MSIYKRIEPIVEGATRLVLRVKFVQQDYVKPPASRGYLTAQASVWIHTRIEQIVVDVVWFANQAKFV